jgi:hypothetical protein
VVGSTLVTGIRNSAKAQADQLAADLNKRVNMDLNAHARYLAVKSGALKPDFADAWVTSGLAKIFQVDLDSE